VLDVNRNLPAVVARTNGSGEILDYFVYGAAGLVSKITPAGQAFTYHFDPTGSTVAMSDSSENLVNTYAYTPYGKTARQETIDNPFEYIGQFGVMAEDNGLNYMRARFYHPGIRRFISRDTVWGEVSSPQSLNLYAYVEGNPVMRVDPSGNVARPRSEITKNIRGNSPRTSSDDIDRISRAIVNYGVNKIPIVGNINKVEQIAEDTDKFAYKVKHQSDDYIDVEIYNEESKEKLIVTKWNDNVLTGFDHDQMHYIFTGKKRGINILGHSFFGGGTHYITPEVEYARGLVEKGTLKIEGVKFQPSFNIYANSKAYLDY